MERVSKSLTHCSKYAEATDMEKNILIINNEFPPIGGGAGNASFYLAKNLSKLGHRVRVVTAGFRDLPPREEEGGVTINRVKCSRRKRFESGLWELLSYAGSAVRFISRELKAGGERYDISICFHTLPAGMVSYALLRNSNVPYIVMLRGGDVPGFLPERFRYYHMVSMPVIKAVWKNARHVVANSKGLGELAGRTACRIGREVLVIENGVDLSSFQARSRHRFDGTLRMLFVGRLEKQKGIPYLIEAVSLLAVEDRERVRVDLIGEGPERAVLEEMIEERGLRNFRFLGYFPHDRISTRFGEADLFVLPSLYEGMPNALLEAMAGGLPALVTDIMGNNELVENEINGFLVPPADPWALRTAIMRFLERPELLSEFRENTLCRVRKFDWMKATQELNNLIMS